MMIKYLTLSAALFVMSCGAQHASTRTATTPIRDAVQRVAPKRFKFSFYLSGSGIDNKPQDAFKMDTAHMMGVQTSAKDSMGNWHTLHALAELDPPDFDTLSTIIYNGDLVRIDSSDLTEQCAPDELFILDIVPADGSKPLLVRFNGCAQDYNLLLEPKRREFKALMQWFERMRVKYRPSQPD